MKNLNPIHASLSLCRMLSLVIVTLALADFSGWAAEPRIRPTYGDDSLWGYWEFENDYVPKKDWAIVSVSQEGPGDREHSRNLIDDNPQTFYGPRGKDSYEVVVDLGKNYELGAFTVLTLAPPNGRPGSDMASYAFYVSESKENKGQPVAQGPFEATPGKETVITFAAAKGRYVTLQAYAPPGATKEIAIRELCLVEAATVTRYQSQKKTAKTERQERWKSRDSEAAIAELGKELLDQLICLPDERNRANLQGRPKLETVGKLKAAKKYAEALKEFRDYYFDKMRRPQAYGLHAGDLHPYGRGFAGIGEFPQAPLNKDLDSDGQQKQIPLADDLMKGLVPIGGNKILIGEPGFVDWTAPAQPYGWSTKARADGPYRELWWGTGFQPLFTAYMVTKNEEYLKRWLAYMDDWALNCDFLAEIHPIINHDNQMYPVVTTLRMLAAIANTLPYGSETVTPQVFARIMKKLVHESPLNYTVYMRSNPNAWTPGAGMMLLCMLVDEFKVAPLYFRETRRRNIEDINAIQMLRDGTDPHQWPGYNPLVLINTAAIRLMNARENMPTWMQPAWERDLHTPAWQNELTELLCKRATYLMHWNTPTGEYPLITHHEPPSQRQKIREMFDRLPSMFNDPLNRKLYANFYGDKSGDVPEYTSDWFPYGGFSIARTGWGRQDGYGALFCSPKPGCGGSGTGCKNNLFGLAAYGMDLLADDLCHFWVRPVSPISVDKRQQQIDYYVPRVKWPTGHKGELTRSWTDPAPWRWHSSDNFNVMEGIYSGPYANQFYDRKDFIDDVSHQRLVLFARHAGLWIVTDRMLTAKKHDYEQLWWLPLKKPEREFAGFSPEGIVVNSEERSIKTRRTRTDKWWSWDDLRDIVVGNVNLSMYQFTDATLKYDSKTTKSNEEMYNWQRVGVTWPGEGNQQVVTALFPRKPTPEKKDPDGTENDLASIKPLQTTKDVSGFEAITPDGDKVSYLAAKTQSATLEMEGIKATAEALLVTMNPVEKDVLHVLVLGCKDIAVKGKPVAVTHPDFEFDVNQSESRNLQNVYRPISPVAILPESDAFADELEVSLTCETPNVIMTYTLDGTEPAPQSTLYKGPFKINRSYVVKARAYRPGVDKNPPNMSGTHATATTYALYTKKLWSTPEQVTPKAAGLNFEYCEGYWKDLWLFPGKNTAKKKGEVAELFDMSVIPEDNKALSAKAGGPVGLAPREKAYAFTYTGYLKIPEDGVYTIHAPREFTHPDQIAGYELQVYLGHAMLPDNNGTKRDGDLNFWYPATRLHGLGTWSVPLKKGFHDLKIVYIDFRMDGAKRLNYVENVRDCVWSGERPELLISGPNMKKQTIPAGWLWH
ncbi:MAG TPA: chitobiase/beta-hexosaminidase C-terminal domain-containing protein [Planctomycetota bacterium]|jgi:hypothetical protein